MLLIFDLDGTLCLSSDLDNACYQEACQRVLGVQTIDTDWSNYPDATDPVIGRTLIERHVPGAAADDALAERKLAALHHAFIELIRERMRPADCRETPGAAALLREINAALAPTRDASVTPPDPHDRQGAPPPPAFAAIATGGWRISAELKLQTAGIDPGPHVPIRTSNDARKRTDIIRAAWAAAEANAGRTFKPTDVTYFGDGVWDLQATRQLNINFIGVGAERGKAQRLQTAGAAMIIDHWPTVGELVRTARLTSS